MRSPPSGIAAQYASTNPTLAYALKITRADTQVFGFTSADVDATISSVLYKASPGLDPTSIDVSAGLSVDNLELSTIDDGTVFSKADVLGGVWRNAVFVLFRYNWSNLADGIDTLLTGNLGEGQLLRNTVVFELRGLQQYLQQGVGDVSSKQCRARLGDTLCTKDLTTFRFSGTVTTAGQQQFIASAMAQATDYFTEGEIAWLTGANAGLHRKVKSHVTGGVFTLSEPMLRTVLVGDTFQATAGCMKRLTEDCITKFANVLNFQGEPHRPNTNDLIKPAEPSV